MIRLLKLHWQNIDLVTRRPYDSYPAHKLARLLSLEKATLPGGFFLSEQQSIRAYVKRQRMPIMLPIRSDARCHHWLVPLMTKYEILLHTHGR